METISIASFLPIIEYFSGENVVGIYSYIENLNIPYLDEYKKIYTLLFLLFLIFVIKNLYLVIFYWLESKFIFKSKMNLTFDLFKKYLYQDFKFHVNKNSSNLISNLNVEIDIFENSLSFITILVVESMLLFFLLVFIFYFNPFISIILFSFAFLFLILLYSLLKKEPKKLEETELKQM